MNVSIDATSTTEGIITMTQLLDAPRDLVWIAFTDPKHVTRWYGGAGFSNPVCEMDVRPGGIWNHVMRTPDGSEHALRFEFVDVVQPSKLSWRTLTEGVHQAGPTTFSTLTLEAQGRQTRSTFVTRFASIAERDMAMKHGFAEIIRQGTEKMDAVLAELVRTTR